jgi:predicted permease
MKTTDFLAVFTFLCFAAFCHAFIPSVKPVVSVHPPRSQRCLTTSTFTHASLKHIRSPKLNPIFHPAARAAATATVTINTAAKAASASASSAVVTRAAVKAIAKLLSTCGIGVAAAKSNVLDQNAVAVLSKLIFYLFQPCLLFVNVAQTVAAISKGTGNPAAIYLLPLAAMFQILVGYIVGKIIALIMGTSSEDESSKQLLACTTFANSGPLPLVFTDGLFRSHPNTALLSNSVAYVSLYLLGWSPAFWILAPAILQDNKVGNTEQNAKSDLIKRIFSPPVIGSLLGMVFGFIPFLRQHMISSSGLLNPVFESMRTLGTAYLPAVLMVLAGSLLQSGSSTSTGEVGTEENESMITKLAAVLLARFALMPLIGFSLYKLANQFIPASRGLFERDPLLLFILLLESCMPSAQNTTVILQLQGNKSAAARLARTLMIIYVLGVPAMSFWLVKILELTGLAA